MKFKKPSALLFTFCFVSVFAFLFVSGCLSPSQPNTDISIGSKAPDFEFSTLDKDSVRLSDFGGRIVLLNFWSIRCGPCLYEMPAFETLQREYKDDLIVLAVNIGEPKMVVGEFKNKTNPSFTLGILNEKKNFPYPISSIPYTVLIDKDGNIAYIQIGAYDAETMYKQYYKPEIEKLLKT